MQCCALRVTTPVAAAHDCQEGGDLLEQALFAPAKVGVFEVAQHGWPLQTRTQQSGLGLKMNKSGTTKYENLDIANG